MIVKSTLLAVVALLDSLRAADRRRCVMGVRNLAISLVASLCIETTPANARPLTVEFAGQITSYSFATDDPFDGDVQIGDFFVGRYTFESDLPDLVPSPTSGSYQNPFRAPYGITLSFGGQTFRANTISEVLVINDFFHPAFSELIDTFTVGAKQRKGNDPNGETLFQIGFVLVDSTGTALLNDSLPLSPPTLANFDITDFLFTLGDFTAREPGSAEIRGNILFLQPRQIIKNRN